MDKTKKGDDDKTNSVADDYKDHGEKKSDSKGKKKDKIKTAEATAPAGTKAADLDGDDEEAKEADAKLKEAEKEKQAHLARVLGGEAKNNADKPDTKSADPKALAKHFEHKE